MIVRMPPWIGRVRDHYLDYVNVPVWQMQWHGRDIEVRRIDLLTAYGFIACVGWYWLLGNWQTALLGGLLYVLLTMASLWIL